MVSNSESHKMANSQSRVAKLGVIAMDGASELGKRIDKYLVEWSKKKEKT